MALDNLADQRRSNEILKQALKVYLQLLQLDSELVPSELFIKAAEKCINRMRFLGESPELNQFYMKQLMFLKAFTVMPNMYINY